MIQKFSTSSSQNAKVLVVGGGPVGLITGYLLDKVYGIPTRIIEKESQPTPHPQAHFLSLRTMETLQTFLPSFHNQLMQKSRPPNSWRDYVYCTALGPNSEIARIDQFGKCIPRELSLKSALSGISSTQFLNFPQNRFEDILYDIFDQEGMIVERGVELKQLVDGNLSNQSTQVSLYHSESQELERAQFEYVIGADGTHSLVRQQLGIKMSGQANIQSIANIYFKSKSLAKLTQDNPGLLYFIYNPQVIGILIAHDLSRGEWVIQVPFFPPQESLALDFSKEQCRQILTSLFPAKSSLIPHDIEILSIGQWQMHARVANEYVKQGKFFLVGDAAHQFPPAGGFGMNTGIQDASNLAWKLALRLQQPSSVNDDTAFIPASKLISSYQKERQSIAELTCQLSLRNVDRNMKVLDALHIHQDNATTLLSLANAWPMAIFSSGIKRSVVKNLMTIGKTPLSVLQGALHDKVMDRSLGSQLVKRIQDIVHSRSSLGMLFYHFDIGYSYNTKFWEHQAKRLMQDDALINSNEFNLIATDEKSVIYAPQFQVGMRFPHFWLSSTSLSEHQSTNGNAISTIELPIKSQLSINVQYVLLSDREAWTWISTEINKSTTSLNTKFLKFLKQHVTMAIIHDTKEVASSSSQYFANVQDWYIHESTSLRKYDEFKSQYSVALIRPDGHIASLWDNRSNNALKFTIPDLQIALQQSMDLI